MLSPQASSAAERPAWPRPVLALVAGFATGLPSVTQELTPLALALLALAWALLALAWALRGWSLGRNAALKPRSTLQPATGLPQRRLVQKSMGMSAGAFNTREFFHTASSAAMRHVRWALHGLCFAAPLLLGGDTRWVLLALLLHVPTLLAERWLFFARARHPQNLYYQVVS